jgi:hypothetical protein
VSQNTGNERRDRRERRERRERRDDVRLNVSRFNDTKGTSTTNNEALDVSSLRIFNRSEAPSFWTPAFNPF